MERHFVEMEESLRKMAEEVKYLHRENEALKRTNTELQHEVGPSKNEQEEFQSIVG